MLTKRQILLAAESVLDHAVFFEIEDRDARASFPEGMDRTDVVDKVLRENESDVICQMARLIGRVDQAWGCEVGLVFYHMGLETDEEIGNALFYLVMGCLGEGVSLADDHGELLEKAGKILHKEFVNVPVHIGSEWFTELLYGHLIYEDEVNG